MSRLLDWLRRVLGMRAPGPPALPVRMDSPEEYWLDRARTAADRCRLVARQARQGAVADRCREVAAQASVGLATMERLAGQASLLHRTLAGMNLSGLRSEEGRLRAAIAARPEGVVGEAPDDQGGAAGIERSLASVQEQERVAARLEQTQAALLGRLEASAMEMEGLHAGLAEVAALAETGGGAGEQRLELLAREVEGLRQGLLEAVSVGRLALDEPSAIATGVGSPIVPVTDVDSPRTS